MSVYQFRTSVTAVAGSATSVSLKVTGGMLGHVIARANTDTTVFRANLVDESDLLIQSWGFHTGEINDPVKIPVSGDYTFNIISASPNDTFNLYFAVDEGK